MWRFSEKFMEDCVHADPSSFVGESLEIVSRQVRLGGFVPDLILKDPEGKIVILEIQMNALDRYHLYKSLEYRDLWALQMSSEAPRIVLLCETIDDRFRPLMKTHSIELVEIKRDVFIKIAIQKTPEIIAEHLIVAGASSEIKPEISKERKLKFNPLGWGYRTRPSDVLAHFHEELGRLNIGIDQIHRERYGRIYSDTCNFLDEDVERVLEALWVPGAWDWERLKARSDMRSEWRPYPDISKPIIYVTPYITQKGNLSVIWRPYEWRTDDSDWKWWRGEGTYGWSRPQTNYCLFEMHLA